MLIMVYRPPLVSACTCYSTECTIVNQAQEGLIRSPDIWHIQVSLSFSALVFPLHTQARTESIIPESHHDSTRPISAFSFPGRLKEKMSEQAKVNFTICKGDAYSCTRDCFLPVHPLLRLSEVFVYAFMFVFAQNWKYSQLCKSVP